MSDTGRQQEISQGLIEGLVIAKLLGEVSGSAIGELNAGKGLSSAGAERLVQVLEAEWIMLGRMTRRVRQLSFYAPVPRGTSPRVDRLHRALVRQAQQNYQSIVALVGHLEHPPE